MKCDECNAEFKKGYSGDDANLCDPCYEAEWKSGALAAGIPLSVIEGKTKLSDHFSQEYIQSQCGHKE